MPGILAIAYLCVGLGFVQSYIAHNATVDGGSDLETIATAFVVWLAWPFVALLRWLSYRARRTPQ